MQVQAPRLIRGAPEWVYVMKTLSIDMRLAGPGDAAAIADAHRNAWMHAYSGIIPYRALTRMVERRGESWWRKATRGPATILVAEVAGQVAGYASLGYNRARVLPHEGEIYELYLRPEYQGIGLGYQLFHEARRILNSLGCNGMVVWCLEDSEIAANFFRTKRRYGCRRGMEDFDDVHLKKLGFIWN